MSAPYQRPPGFAQTEAFLYAIAAAQQRARQQELNPPSPGPATPELPTLPYPLTTATIRELYKKYAGNLFWATALVMIVWVFGNRGRDFRGQQGL